MINEEKLAIYTLRKIIFFNEIKKQNIDMELLLNNIQYVYNLNKNKSIEFLYKKAIHYTYEQYVSKIDIIKYVLNQN